ncbi:hypothetical protein [Vagococcus xieshaowenii]|uniref:Thioredoxin-like fold domain-containing protein n=1 Tax=Vagococcus xieshaowenii TaxID=2562451 RepID=A0AAJ5EG23_9ENTE|nr:hypothetical protein [Vagococcus xieshaowenii]QCA28236.1 hypothetical protein E4Z98_02485 [Vagococcus xieshaowenii]TFZ41891.1 hypothetical protein E4031_04665 [Vagococcus xieshaowenii]
MKVEVHIYTLNPNCRACKLTKQQFSKVTKVFNERINAEMLDNLKATGVKSMPYVQIIQDQKLLDSWSGLKPDRISSWIKVIKKEKSNG